MGSTSGLNVGPREDAKLAITLDGTSVRTSLSRTSSILARKSSNKGAKVPFHTASIAKMPSVTASMAMWHAFSIWSTIDMFRMF